MDQLNHAFRAFRHDLLPNYKGTQMGLNQAYEMYKKYMPEEWDLKLSDEEKSEINYKNKVIELSFENWTEEIILHSIGTVILELTKGVFSISDTDPRLRKVNQEKELWVWIKEKSIQWDWRSELLRMKALDWYYTIPEEQINTFPAFGLEIK